jgi:tetratricopeptide (TPR) repeat protein
LTSKCRRSHLLLASFFFCWVNLATAQSADNLLPKYGLLPETDGQKAADKAFISGMDHDYHGDLKKAANDMALRGWQYLKQGDPDDAMRRFNQAWLLDKTNGTALWGMAAIEADKEKYDDSLKLFAEAEKSAGGEINFTVDYARTVGAAAIARNDDALLKDALDRFQHIYEKAPQNVRNLQNWATILYQKDRYSEAWSKVKLAEATPNKNQLNPRFLAELEAHMPRPRD